MSQGSDRARQGRTVAIVIVATSVCWLALNWIGATAGWGRGTFLAIDLAAMAAFLWSLIVAWQIWKRRD